MDRLKRARRPVRGQVTRLVNELTGILNQDEPNKGELRLNFELLEKAVVDLEDLDNQVKNQMLDDQLEDAVIDEEIKAMEDYRKAYLTIKINVDELCAKGSFLDSASETGDKRRKFKLPTVQLKTFGGNLKEWLGWWSQFRKINDDEELHDSDKFQYLVQAMEPCSEAKDLVDSYPQTDGNYRKAVEALQERFGRHDLLLQVYVRELLTLVISNVTAKEKIPLSQLYVRLESHLRSLAELNLDKADPKTWLFPLVESSLAEETLRAWQRSSYSRTDNALLDPDKSRLDFLMDFIKGEVRSDQQILLAQSGFKSSSQTLSKAGRKGSRFKSEGTNQNEEYPTAAGLMTGQVAGCVFCAKSHPSDRCFKAQAMSVDEKRKVIKQKRLCYRCLRPGHTVKACKIPVKCDVCDGKHYAILCFKSETKREESKKSAEGSVPVPPPNQQQTANVYQTTTSQCSPNILLNTLTIELISEEGTVIPARLVGDTGSQRSYGKTTKLMELGCQRVGQEWLQQVLFGGQVTAPQLYGRFRVNMRGINGIFGSYELLEKQDICGRVQKVPYGHWIEELNQTGIQISDLGEGYHEIDILIGNDLWGNLLTGNLVKLSCGLVATETIFGWTLGGSVLSDTPYATMTVCSLLSTTQDISSLWTLDTIGITDPVESKTTADYEKEALEHFSKTVRRDGDGRYIVALPWNCEEKNLPSNRCVAEKRLHCVTSKLSSEKFLEYDQVFKMWEKEDLVATITLDKGEGHYLPHRPVYKENSSTPTRPVYDASCHVGRSPSLNDCLHKGPNLIELIPAVLLRFREKSIGVYSDIRKAFQMVKVQEEDQTYQKFLWWTDSSCTSLKVYQHKRVVFGMTCSPFILGAVIAHHLKNSKKNADIAEHLARSFYVDNCVTSVDSVEDYSHFRQKATELMSEACMELRQWGCSVGDKSGVGLTSNDRCGLDLGDNGEQSLGKIVSVLGIKWNREEDTLSYEIKDFPSCNVITKRTILSVLAKVFDPFGYLCPALLLPKLLIQESWTKKFQWDDPVPEDVSKRFITWTRGLSFLKQITVQRHFQLTESSSREIHVFCDSSSDSYAACVFIRTEFKNQVEVQLVLAKSRLSPIKKPTIPRLELMSCLIGTRLATTVQEALGYMEVPIQFWSDSTTALSWIRRDGKWGVFVSNRVKEILRASRADQWRHVPGIHNPADLPSRGCSPRRLLQSEWWRGPMWLRENKEKWPTSEPPVNESEVSCEERKMLALTSTPEAVTPRFSNYKSNVAVWGWVMRFINSLRGRKSKSRFLTISELRKAEKAVIRKIQEESFPEKCDIIAGIQVYRDDDGLLRVKSRLANRKDKQDFIFPILLPKVHPLVDQLITDLHKYHGHGGVQFLLSKLREKYWVIQSRRVVRRLVRGCVVCRRHSAKRMEVEPAPLPEKRVQNSEPFETTGVDLAGPLYLKDKQKAWVVLYTCAVYRCLFLDLVTSLSTEAFLGSLERFVSIHGRPNTMYSDNGTNFVGSANIFKELDWKEIEEKTGARQIQWIFNPPTAAWWGGWWEVLVRIVKDLIKRMLGRSKITYDEMRTCLAGVTSTINDRPLTLVTEDNKDLVPLTPGMFMKARGFGHVPDGGSAMNLSASYQTMKVLQAQLQDRFRREYLSKLVTRGGPKKGSAIQKGDVVLVGADNRKRYEWPLGIVEETFPGKDGKIRVALVKTATGNLMRPLQRLYPLEVPQGSAKAKVSVEEEKADKDDGEPTTVTRSGRATRKPTRYGCWLHLIKY